MITSAAFLVLLFAASLPVTYILIIHRSLSGRAANDPNFDVDAQKERETREEFSPPSGSTAKHA